MTIDFSLKPILAGDLVVLRPVASTDARTLHQLMADEEVSVLTGSVHADGQVAAELWSLEQLEEVYARWSVAEDRIVWVIIERKTGNTVGESVLHDLDSANRACGFRIWISGARDRGLGTEATRLTMGHAFEGQGLHRVELEVFDFNPRALHVYDNVGFVHEGTRREALRYNDGWVDAHRMAILESDWFARGKGQ
ncbi:MAG: GNAT family N-acetyltransferase [Actinomycetes bacterium]